MGNPGGKLELGETPEQCIVRKIKEELATEVKAEKILGVVEYEAAKWVNKETLRSVDWLPTDQLILDKIEEIL